MANPGEDEVFAEESLWSRHLVLIGKTGNGKSTLGNMILGRRHFQVGCSMKSTTVEVSVGEACSNGLKIKVIDTPDILNLGYEDDEAQREVAKWKALTSPEIHAVLLVVRCDVRYTREEHNIYLQLKRLWGGNSLARRLVVAFTFGDHQDTDIKEDLKHVCPELKSVLRDASKRYVVFNDKDDEENKKAQVTRLLKIVRKLDAEVTRQDEERLMSAVQVCPQGPLMMLPYVQPSRSSSSGRSSSGSLGSISSDKDAIRLLLIGKTGTGKSSTGNTIIGREAFPVNSDNSTPHAASREDATIGGHYVQVVDTPGLQMDKENDMDFRKERKRALHLIYPGPHVIILVLRNRDFSDQDLECFNALKKQLGPSIHNHILYALVGAGEEGESISASQHVDAGEASEAFNAQGQHGQDMPFSALLREAWGPTWLVSNKKRDQNERINQVNTLMQMVQSILNRTSGECLHMDQVAQGMTKTRHGSGSGGKGKDHDRYCWFL